MKSSVKKIFSVMAVVVALFAICAITAFAEDYGNFSYSPVVDENDESKSYHMLVGYNSSDDATETVIAIPATIEDIPITKISPSTFQGNENLTEVIIPDTVTEIGNAAFKGCTALEIVIIPESVKIIGDSAFQGCTALKTVLIGNGVVEIGDIAFKDCSALKELSLGSSLQKIGNGAFYNCPELKKVYIHDTLPENGIGNLAFGFVQDENTEKAVEGFTFYTNASKAVEKYNNLYTTTTDITNVSFTFAVEKNVKICEASHNVKLTSLRVATESYEGLDGGQCDKCLTIHTVPNTNIAPKETSILDILPMLIIIVFVLAAVVLIFAYIKKSKASRAKAIEEYAAGKTLSDAALKKVQDEKLAVKYAKKRAKQEKRLEVYKKEK